MAGVNKQFCLSSLRRSVLQGNALKLQKEAEQDERKREKQRDFTKS